MPLLPTIKEEESLTWFQKMWHCRLQFQLMAPALLVYFTGGLKLGWSIFESPPAQFDYAFNSDVLTVSWFIGAMLGAAFAALFVGKVTKNIAHLSSGSLLIVGGILFVALSNIFIALVLSCVCEGIAMGLMQVQTFTSGGELTSKDIRGLVMSTERCFLWLGILMQLTFAYFWYALEPVRGHTIQPDQIHGIAVACFGLATIIVTLRQRTESPLLLLQQQRELAVTAVLKQLTGTLLTTTEVMRKREDCLQLLAVDAEQSGWYVFRKHNARPVFKVLILRCFVTLTMSRPMNRLYLSASWIGFNCDSNCLYTMAAVGTIGSILGSVLIDRCGRRKMCVVTLLPATVFTLITGGMMVYLAHAEVAIMRIDLEIIASLMLLFQFIICVGVSAASSVYLSEAFTITQKSKCVACVLIAEYGLQLALAIVSAMTVVNEAALFFAIGFLCLLLGLCVFFCMPETKCITLYECLQKFKSV